MTYDLRKKLFLALTSTTGPYLRVLMRRRRRRSRRRRRRRRREKAFFGPNIDDKSVLVNCDSYFGIPQNNTQ